MVKLKSLFLIGIIILLISFSKQASYTQQLLFITGIPKGELGIQITGAASVSLPSGGNNLSGDTNWLGYILGRTGATTTVVYKGSSVYDTSTYLSRYEDLIPTFAGFATTGNFFVVHDFIVNCDGSGAGNPPKYISYKVRKFCDSALAEAYYDSLTSTTKVALSDSGVQNSKETTSNADGKLNATFAASLLVNMDTTLQCSA